MTALAGRWGAWATVLWSLGVIVVFYVVQTGFAMVYMSATMARVPAERAAAELAKLGNNGDVVAVATILSTPACLLAIFAIVKVKRGGTFEDMLALRVPPASTLVRWLLLLVAFAALSDALTVLLGKPIVPDFMRAVYGSADSKGTLWFAFVLAAPVFEEVLFRGFMITGLASSRLGASGAVLLTAVTWAVIHSQYDLYGVLTIFAMGLLLGAARVKTSTVAVPLAMHILMNAIATLEAALF